MIKLSALVIIAAGFTFLAAEQGSACSVCRCDEGMMLCSAGSSDQSAQSLNALPDKGKFRFQLRNLLLSKSNGLAIESSPSPVSVAKLAQAGTPAGTEHEREFRPSLRASYGITNQLTLSAELPYSFKRIEEQAPSGNTASSTSGFGDAELTLAWSTPFARTQKETWTLGFGGTLKTPTGSNNSIRNSERLDEHLQPGSGSYDWQFGSTIARVAVNSSEHVSLYVRLTGTNSFAYHYGKAILYNLGMQQRIAQSVFGTIQIDGRHASRDTQDRLDVDNTGGSVLYLSPGIRLRVTPRVSLIASVQIPVWENLYGIQSEKAVLNTGVSLDW